MRSLAPPAIPCSSQHCLWAKCGTFHPLRRCCGPRILCVCTCTPGLPLCFRWPDGSRCWRLRKHRARTPSLCDSRPGPSSNGWAGHGCRRACARRKRCCAVRNTTKWCGANPGAPSRRRSADTYDCQWGANALTRRGMTYYERLTEGRDSRVCSNMRCHTHSCCSGTPKPCAEQIRRPSKLSQLLQRRLCLTSVTAATQQKRRDTFRELQ